MTYEVDFEKIICGTRSIEQIPNRWRSQNAYTRCMETYRDIEERIRGKKLAQSLEECLAVWYWLKDFSLDEIADRLTKISRGALYDGSVRLMMQDLNIPGRGNGRRNKIQGM